MTKRTIFSIIFSALVICVQLTVSTACAQLQSAPHRYLNIPFETATPEVVNRTLLEHRGVSFETSSKVLSGRAYNVEEFGYLFSLQYDFRGSYTGTHRILLSSAPPVRVPENEFMVRIRSDFAQFLDMENQLSALYGEADCRFFVKSGANAPGKGRYMFAEGCWTLENLLGVCEKNAVVKVYSIWDNVVLATWIDWQRPNVKGEYLSRVMLYYYPKHKDTAGMIEASVSVLPVQKTEAGTKNKQ